MTHTPTHEQLQEFKDWYYHRYGDEGALTGALADYELCTAYVNHVLMSGEDYILPYTNFHDKADVIEVRHNDYLKAVRQIRKVSMLRQLVKKLNDNARGRIDKVVELVDEISALKEQLIYLKHEVSTEKRFRILDAISAQDEQLISYDKQKELQQQLTEARKEIEGLKERMTRARMIITNGNPTENNNWAILDVSPNTPTA